MRAKQVSSEEVVREHLTRIAAVNPKLNAVVQLRGDGALEDARHADAALARGDRLGPLHGVPMTIKDSLDTAGVITTAGTKGRAHYIPPTDATVVARLKAAGAILLGKTNTPEFTLGIETDNLVYGRTNNPYDLTRMVGGSSGGPAAIVAAEGSPFDVGSDTGGSIRMPAHHCGVAGLKPTSCRVPRTGHIVSYGAGHLDAFTQLGPIARYVDDLEFLLPILIGMDWQDPAIVDMPLGHSSDVSLTHLRVAFFTDNKIDPVTPAISDAVRKSASVLEKAGAHIEEAAPSELADTMDVVGPVVLGDGGAWCKRMIERAGTKELTPNVRGIASFDDPLPTGEFTAALERVDRYRSAFLRFMKDHDVILCPVESYTALPHGKALKRPAETYVYPST